MNTEYASSEDQMSTRLPHNRPTNKDDVTTMIAKNSESDVLRKLRSIKIRRASVLTEVKYIQTDLGIKLPPILSSRSTR